MEGQVRSKLLLAASIAALTVAATAEEIRVEDKNVKCTTTENGNQKKVVCIAGDGQGPGPEELEGGPHVVAPGNDVDVQVFNDGKTEKRVVIVRTKMGSDGADENKDGKVSRKEFLARAEKHFAELDRDKNGVLEKDELHPPMPPLPPLPPGVAPLPPVPPVPPVPPAPPAQN
jgi:hypothetical protein